MPYAYYANEQEYTGTVPKTRNLVNESTQVQNPRIVPKTCNLVKESTQVQNSWTVPKTRNLVNKE